MKTLLKNIVGRTYKPLLVKYLSKTRIYRYKDTRLEIAPQVFHPGFFFSTQLLLQYISKMQLRDKKFLELGFGSGLISIVAAKKGAKVTSTEINTVAIEFFEKNCRQNHVDVQIIESDLFKNIPKEPYDIIAINPPYYKKDPVTEHDHAWFCGENGEYFSALFESLGIYIHQDTQILMVLFEGCDMEMINRFAAAYSFSLSCVLSKKNLLEKNFIFKIEKQNE